jgi:DNA-directed RNA polymerase sigma subunit (sigma70/sigma32)
MSDDEIMDKLHINVEELDRLRAYHNPTSLDIPLGDDDSNSIKDLIPTAHYSLEDEVTEQVFEDSKKEVWNIVEDNVSPKVYKYISGYYKEGMTYGQLAELEKVSANAVREMVNNNLKALRRGKVANILKSKFEEVDNTVYHTSLSSFKYTDSSIEEKIILKKEYYERRYKAN